MWVRVFQLYMASLREAAAERSSACGSSPGATSGGSADIVSPSTQSASDDGDVGSPIPFKRQVSLPALVLASVFVALQSFFAKVLHRS